MLGTFGRIRIAGIICASILFCTLSVNAEDIVFRMVSFQNDLIVVHIRITTVKPQIVRMFQGRTCIDAACGNKFTMAGDLTTFGGKIKDFVINRTISGETKFSGVCSYVLQQDGSLTIPTQRTFNFQPALRNTGISSLNVFQTPDLKVRAAYFKFTEDPDLIAHAGVTVNQNSCSLAGPAKEYYRVLDNEFQTSPKPFGTPLIGAITKNEEGFELYFANVLIPGFVGETKLTIPGGQSVRVISAALAAGPIGTSPGNAGVPTNKVFLLYRILHQQGSIFQTSVLLQTLQIQGNTLVASGTPKTIAPFTATGQAGAESVHSVALGPNGNYAIYTSFNTGCAKETVKYQKLNPNTGSKIGGPSVLLDCAAVANTSIGAYGLDLIPTLNQ